MKPLASKLRRWRRAGGLSQAQAARLIGVPLDTLQNWEQARSEPRGFARAVLLELITPSAKR